MFDGACCPGKNPTRKITVGGQQIGISFLDQIIEKALSAEGMPEAELKSMLLRELKVYNYVPLSAEGAYLDAIWEEFLKARVNKTLEG